MIALINNMVPGKFGINFYMCMGQDPTNYDFLGKKMMNVSITHDALRVLRNHVT